MAANPDGSAAPDFRNFVRDFEESMVDLLERKRYHFAELFSENEVWEHVPNQELVQAVFSADVPADIPGAFVLFYENRPLYIDVSRKVFRTFRSFWTVKF